MPEQSIAEIEFVDATIGMNIPKNFIPAIEKVTNYICILPSSPSLPPPYMTQNNLNEEVLLAGK